MSISTTKTTSPIEATQKVFLLLDEKGQYILLDQSTFIKKFDTFKNEANNILQPFAFYNATTEHTITTQTTYDTNNIILRTDQYLTNIAGAIIENNWHVWGKNAECFGMRNLSHNNKRQPISHELKYLILAYKSSLGEDLNTPEALTFDKATTKIEKFPVEKLVTSLRP